MDIKYNLLLLTMAVVVTGYTAPVAAAAPWTRGFVVGTYEYAFRYGGRPDFKRGSTVEPGVDCPHGSSVNFSSPDETKKALIRQKWRSQQDINLITAPPGLDQLRKPGTALKYIWARAISYRGYKKGIETYVNPWAAEDPGQPEVASRIGEGFNLDGKIGPYDFISPDGEKGVDNALYRAMGCEQSWRGNLNSSLAQIANIRGPEFFTMVIRISGNQDPMNDSDATVEVGYSPDTIVKNAQDKPSVDYSYRILKSSQYTRLKAKIRNGIVDTEQVEHLHIPRIAWRYSQAGDANFINGKIRLNIAADGLSGTGLIGGYRNWRDLYAENTFATYGGRIDVFALSDRVAFYYALRRNADGLLDNKTGKHDGISTVYRIKMASAYVVDPDKPMDIPIPTVPAENLWEKKGFEPIKTIAIKSIETRIPQDVPPSTAEAAFPDLEELTKGLSNREYLLTILDRPHYRDGTFRDENGHVLDDEGNIVGMLGTEREARGNPVGPSYTVEQSKDAKPATAPPTQGR